MSSLNLHFSSQAWLWVPSMLRGVYLPDADDDDGLVDCKHAFIHSFAPFKFNDHFTAGISRPSELTTMKSYYCAWPSEDVCFGWFMSDLSRNASFWQFYLGGVQLAKWNLRGSVRKRVPFRHTPYHSLTEKLLLLYGEILAHDLSLLMPQKI